MHEEKLKAKEKKKEQEEAVKDNLAEIVTLNENMQTHKKVILRFEAKAFFY